MLSTICFEHTAETSELESIVGLGRKDHFLHARNQVVYTFEPKKFYTY